MTDLMLWPPGASDAYVSARQDLLARERELRDQLERLAEARRALPAGAVLPDYVLDEGEQRRTHLADLFDGHDTLVIYHMMFQPGDDEACAMCSMWVDGFDGVSVHLAQRASFAVVAKAPIDDIRAWAKRRGWTRVRLLSSYLSTFNADLGVEDPDGSQRPAISVFLREEGGTVRHAYTMQAGFSSTEQDRGIDLLSPVWQVLDLLPQGRNGWWAGNDYVDRLAGNWNNK
jgi:predicted dithiol-disulfide oxidoreductase (DUF899 family)